MNILLGLTGSVASVLHVKIAEALQEVGNVSIIPTPSTTTFLDEAAMSGFQTYTDKDEWQWASQDRALHTKKWTKGQPVLHIQLRDTGSALVIAPCSANTLAKLASGLCDNLLTSVARAWDLNRPVIIAPAMNTHMWNHPITQEHIAKLKAWGYIIVHPQSKMLACQTLGMGAMAEISLIVQAVKESLRWQFPLANDECPGIPVNPHPGSFLIKRKHHIHTGVDLYTKDSRPVYAVEPGKVVGIEEFTGSKQQTPWWEDTQCALIEGATGVVCYGEIIPCVTLGQVVKRGDLVGHVKRVLKPHKLRKDIAGHSTSMLHMEIYPHGKYKAFEELGENPDNFSILKDPTPLLLNAMGQPLPKLQ